MHRNLQRIPTAWLIIGLMAVFTLGISSPSLAADRPNIIFFMFDDLGNADLPTEGQVYFLSIPLSRQVLMRQRVIDPTPCLWKNPNPAFDNLE